MPVETKEVEKPDNDVAVGAEGNDFGSAFSEAAIGAVPDDKPAETQPEKEEGADKAGEKPDAEKKDEDGTKAKSEESKSPEAGADDNKTEETYEALKHKHDTLKGMYEKDTKDLRDKLKELEAKINTKQDTPAPEKKSRKQEIDEQIAGIIEKNEKVKELFKDYDYVAEPMRELLGEIFGEAKAEGSTNEEAVSEVKKELHFMTIKLAHRDFDTLVIPEAEGKPSKLEAFVKSYAGSDKEKIEHAYTDGNAWEVIELVDAYKKSLEAPASTATVPDEVKERREKKLNDLAAVPKKDAAINANSKKKAETFGDAFAEAAGK